MIKSLLSAVLMFCLISMGTAQISLDRIERQGNTPNDEVLVFNYEDGLVTEVMHMNGDTTVMFISYINNKISSIECQFNQTNSCKNYTILYNNMLIDTILLDDDIFYVYTYNDQDQIETSTLYVPINEMPFKAKSVEYEYKGDQLERKRIYEYYSDLEGDWDRETDSYTFDSNSLPEFVHRTYSSGHGYGKTFFIYDNEKLQRHEKKYYNGGDEVVSHYDYIPQYHEGIEYEDIIHPMELFDLFRTMDRFGPNAWFNSEDLFFSGALVTEINIYDQLYGGESSKLTYIYSDGMIAQNHSEEIAKNIFVYPNPTQDELLLKSPHRIQSVGIYDAKGRLQKVWEHSNQALQIQDLEPGFYYIQGVFRDDLGNFSSSFIKK